MLPFVWCKCLNSSTCSTLQLLLVKIIPYKTINFQKLSMNSYALLHTVTNFVMLKQKKSYRCLQAERKTLVLIKLLQGLQQSSCMLGTCCHSHGGKNIEQ
ncbi:unnamed protein product [Acanthoscelides obtectus]|uniref:Uncharacterized protein n=1 Tax=Acanthoscelides obtectus TaxID=200917 RepID=A0A9P0JLS4_ACAOB|nr:unnamed protein product [Acanthoscelides obtectus]CAK1672867.1 hypothetical protein AOBTE_LOCUS29121 [Acanthoscelides obtectus]